MSDEPLHDPLDRLGADTFALPPDTEQLQGHIARRARRVQLRRRILRRVGQAGFAVALYALGVATARLWPAEPTPPRRDEHLAHEAPIEAEPTVTPEAGSPRTPEELEHRARYGAPHRRAERWRRAGDLYLEVRADVDSALRCYREYLDTRPATDESAPVSDTWLLARLRTDIQ
ncbi:MAG: hypothetical protein RL885_12950 [Planctomycetota bacterium]